VQRGGLELRGQLSEDPGQAVDHPQHHGLKDDLGTGRHGGRDLERWQYEITGSAGSGSLSTMKPARCPPSTPIGPLRSQLPGAPRATLGRGCRPLVDTRCARALLAVTFAAGTALVVASAVFGLSLGGMSGGMTGMGG
jgi:hypothetical protein